MTGPAPFAHSIALVVGIDRYGHGIPELRTAANDARRLASLLAEGHGYDVTLLLDEEATQARIADLLHRELPSRVGPDDRVLFYFAGHGVARDGDDGPNGYLLPFDARRGEEETFLHMPSVHDALTALSCRHMLVVLDSCFSGAFRWSGTREVAFDDDVVHQERYDRFVRDPAWQVITSAAQDEKALDQLSFGSLGTRPGEGAHSPFALALFEALGGAGDVIPREGGDGLVTATELYLYLDERLQGAVREQGKRQTPRLWPLNKHEKGEFVFFVPGRDLSLPPAPPLSLEHNPWRGLASYDQGDAALFFGRDAELDVLARQVGALPLTVVLGASGSGKSSLVKAGLLPRLAAGGWTVLPPVRPGTAPLVGLAQALAAGDGAPPPGATPAALTARLRQLLAADPARRVVLVVDQFEELVTLARSRRERDEVLALLAGWLEEEGDRVRLVFTLRTDFEPNFDRRVFGERWTAGRFLVSAMSRAALRQVIEKPASRRVLYFDPPALVEVLLDEVMATPGALPLLSFALSEMYIRHVQRAGGDRAITRADYEAVGGVVGALRARAEAEVEGLDARQRDTLRRVMLRLVAVDGGALARRRVTDSELTYPDAMEHDRAALVVQRLTSARLLVEGKEADGEAFVEPAHDALVRAWGRLLEWVREESGAVFPLALRERLARAAAEWERADAGARGGLLWSDAVRGAQLAAELKRRSPWLNRREQAFARASVRGRRLRRASVAAALTAIAVAGAWALVSGRRASAQAELARVGSIVRTAAAIAVEEPATAGLILGSLDSALLARADDATRLALLQTAATLYAQPRVVAAYGDGALPVYLVASSDDGRWIAFSQAGGAVSLWRRDGRGEPIRLETEENAVGYLAFTPRGDALITATYDGALRVTPVDEPGATPRSLSRPDSLRVRFVSVSATTGAMAVVSDAFIYNFEAGRPDPIRVELPRGHHVPAGRIPGDGRPWPTLGSGEVLVWNAGVALAPARRVKVAGGQPRDAAVHPDGVQLAVLGSRGELWTWRAPTGLRPLPSPPDSAMGVVWSDGGTLLAAHGGDSVVVWDVASGRVVTRLGREGEPIGSVRFSPDGTQLVTTSRYGFEATLWTVEMPARSLRIRGYRNVLLEARFMGDDGHVAVVAADGHAHLWTLDTPLPSFAIESFVPDDTASMEGRGLQAVAYRTDGRVVATSTMSGLTALTWLGDSLRRQVLPTAPNTPRVLAFDADGQRLHGLTLEGVHLTWTLGAAPRLEQHPLGIQVGDAVATTDGRWAVTRSELPTRSLAMSADTAIYLVRMDSGTPAVRLAPPGQVRTCANFSRSGALLVTCDDSGTVRLRRVGEESDEVVARRDEQVTAAAVTNDGKHVAVATLDGAVEVVRVGSDAATAAPLTRHLDAVRWLEFSDDDRVLLLVDEDGVTEVFRWTTGTRLASFRPRGLEVQRAHLTPDGRRVVTLAALDTLVRIWNADGTGGSAALSMGVDGAAEFFLSPDARRLIVTSDNGPAWLWTLDAASLLEPFNSVAACLSFEDRVRLLGETPGVAQERSAACERRLGRQSEPRVPP